MTKICINHIMLFVFFLVLALFTKAEDIDSATLSEDSFSLQFLNYDTLGKVNLGLGLAEFYIPQGFKFLNAEQSKYVLTALWGNPPSETLGMIFPSEANELYPGTWAIEIRYEEDGHVKDDDAKEIKYDELLEEMQKQIAEVNPERKKQGYPSVELVGWASSPYYDEQAKKLHWAKRLKFEGDTSETLNYNIRVLGRKGVLVLNAIGGIEQLAEIKESINPVSSAVNFIKGNKYEDFDSSIDQVAAYGIGGLIAGGVLAKTGLLAKVGVILVKFAKVIVLGAAAVGGAIWKFFSKKKEGA